MFWDYKKLLVVTKNRYKWVTLCSKRSVGTEKNVEQFGGIPSDNLLVV